MFGSPSHQKSRRRRGGYSRLGRGPSRELKEEEGGTPKKEEEVEEKKQPKKGGGKKAHPLQRVLEAPRMDKAMSKPEFMRYLAYMREAGRWGGDSDRPVIFYE